MFSTKISTCMTSESIGARCGKVVMSPNAVDVIESNWTLRKVHSSPSFKSFWTISDFILIVAYHVMVSIHRQFS